MNETARGQVININAYGAMIRLEDGRLASAPLPDVEKNRRAYDRSLSAKKFIEFIVHPGQRHCTVLLAPQIRDAEFEEQIAGYLKMTEEWEKPDVPPAHERHFLRKKKRAAFFESRHAADR